MLALMLIHDPARFFAICGLLTFAVFGVWLLIRVLADRVAANPGQSPQPPQPSDVPAVDWPSDSGAPPDALRWARAITSVQATAEQKLKAIEGGVPPAAFMRSLLKGDGK